MKRLLFIACLLLSMSALKAQWVSINSGITNYMEASAIATDGTYLYAGVADSLYGGVYRSADTGTTWTPVNTGLTGLNVWCIATSGSKLFTSVFGHGIFLSTDFGATWTPINSGLGSVYVFTIVIKDSIAYAGTNAGVFKTSITGSTYNWMAINTGLGSLDVKSIAVNDSNDVIAGTQITSLTQRGLYLLPHGSSTWTQINTGIPGTCVDYISALFAKDTFVLAAGGLNTMVDPPNVFRANSTVSSPTWTTSSTGIAGYEVHSFHLLCNVIFAGCDGGAIFYSTNDGFTWNSWGVPTTSYMVAQTSMGSTLIVAGSLGTGGGFYKRDASGLCQAVDPPDPDPDPDPDPVPDPQPQPAPEVIALEMPNVFSPNADGFNDHFVPIRMSGIKEAKLRIYNRWGEKLAETENLNIGWDGKFNGTNCSDGTYFWLLNYETNAGESVVQKGSLTLIR